jgi:hypothetical protein
MECWPPAHRAYASERMLDLMEWDIFYKYGMDQYIKSDHHPLSIPNIPLFSPWNWLHVLYEPEATIPLFHAESKVTSTPLSEL